VLLDRLGPYRRTHRTGPKQEALKSLCDYVGKRVAMTDYPTFRRLGYDCGSGPTESLCGRLTDRLKGPGMRWDQSNAEAMMAFWPAFTTAACGARTGNPSGPPREAPRISPHTLRRSSRRNSLDTRQELC
jgi:hypothetical protein